MGFLFMAEYRKREGPLGISILLWVLAALLPFTAKTADRPIGEPWKVNAGDTLSHLALRFYGSAHKWPKIYEANAKTLRNPDYIYIGQALLIPADQPELEKKLHQGTG
jgi:LysM repeat protein